MILSVPISVFSLSELNIDLSKLQNKLQKFYNQYEPDRYLLQQSKINALQQVIKNIDQNLLYDIYNGFITDDELIKKFMPAVPIRTLEQITSLQPTRWRLISEYDIVWNDKWKVTRVTSKPFEQNKALIAGNSDDYRLSPRQFKELPDELFDDDLKNMILYIANKIRSSNKSINKLKFVIHHTMVYSLLTQISSNSPEGVHQDGMDYIVSALVVDKVNISGGKSIIYGEDKKTPIFEVELQSGYGLFQPDANTNLWHEVTPITLIDEKNVGFRSIIGFDVEIVN